jgi:hypothetical protein
VYLTWRDNILIHFDLFQFPCFSAPMVTVQPKPGLPEIIIFLRSVTYVDSKYYCSTGRIP